MVGVLGRCEVGVRSLDLLCRAHYSRRIVIPRKALAMYYDFEQCPRAAKQICVSVTTEKAI